MNSHTPGHPEIEMTHGVDASSGPLGQGIPMAAGMAMAEKFLASQYNKENFDIIDHYTYVLWISIMSFPSLTSKTCQLQAS